MMLGKDRMAELRSIAKLHKLVAGSQTIPNSVAEAAAARGESPPVGPIQRHCSSRLRAEEITTEKG